jgi:hypothetical protein
VSRARRAGVAAAAAAAAAAVLVAVVVVATGRGRSSGEAHPASAPSAAPTVPDSRPPEPAPAPAAPTTRTAVPYLAGASGTELVLRAGERVVRVDLASGRTTSVATGEARFEGTNSMVVGDRLLVTGGVLRSLPLVDGDGRAQAAPLPGGWALCGWVPDPVGERVWALPCTGWAQGASVVEYSLGRLVETARRTLPAGVEVVGGYLPGSGFVVEAGGGIYRVGDDGGAVRVATGRVLTAVGTAVATSDCDEHLVCSSDVVDVGTGTVRPLVVPPGFDVRLVDALASIPSPSGDRSVIVSYGGRPVLAVVDVATATVSVLPSEVDVFGTWSAAWSRDGRWLFVQGADDVWAWRVGDGAPVRLAGLPGDRLLGAKG